VKATEKLMSQDDIAVIDPYDQEIEADDESYTSNLTNLPWLHKVTGYFSKRQR